jgi:hypothetical protein
MNAYKYKKTTPEKNNDGLNRTRKMMSKMKWMKERWELPKHTSILRNNVTSSILKHEWFRINSGDIA